MHLHDALTQLAQDLNAQPAELIHYASQDNIGGRDDNTFASMSVHRDEGKVLYALVRLLRPSTVVEIGVAEGCSATHILQALEDNGHGILYSYDIESDNIGHSVPDHLRDRWYLTTGVDAVTVEYPPDVDFCFEDASHKEPSTSLLYKTIRDVMKPQVMVTHDMETHRTYSDFKTFEAYEAVFGNAAGHSLLLDGAFTGLGYWINPEYEAVK